MSLTLFSLTVAFAFQDKANAEDDVKLFQGKWRVVSAKMNGGDYPKDKTEKMSVSIDKDEFRIVVNGTRSLQGAKFALDPLKQPKQIDFTKETDDREWGDPLPSKLFRSWKFDSTSNVIPADTPVQGIYKLERDTLTLCWRTTKAKDLLKLKDGASKELKVRPGLFQSALYYHQFLFVIERVKAD